MWNVSKFLNRFSMVGRFCIVHSPDSRPWVQFVSQTISTGCSNFLTRKKLAVVVISFIKLSPPLPMRLLSLLLWYASYNARCSWLSAPCNFPKVGVHVIRDPFNQHISTRHVSHFSTFIEPIDGLKMLAMIYKLIIHVMVQNFNLILQGVLITSC